MEINNEGRTFVYLYMLNSRARWLVEILDTYLEQPYTLQLIYCNTWINRNVYMSTTEM